MNLFKFRYVCEFCLFLFSRYTTAFTSSCCSDRWINWQVTFCSFLLPTYPVDQRNFYHEISEVANCIKIITDCNDVDTWDHKLLNKNKTLRFSIHTSPDHVVNSLTQPLTCLKPLKQKRSFEDNVHMMKAWRALQGIMCRDTLEV